MKQTGPLTTLFIDIGGVLLTNGWDHRARDLAAKTFHIEREEMENRHRLNFATYEIGKMTLEEYMRRVIFYQKRSFTPEQFQAFMFKQSSAFPEMIQLIKGFKLQHKLKVYALSNEGRELNAYRIQKFKLSSFIDTFISSSYVHLSKPDTDIYKLALDVSQAKLNQIVYIEDRLMFIEVAQSLGIPSIHHQNIESTRAQLEKFC